jgi:DNA modification methylase
MSRVEHLADGVTLYCGDCREILPTLGKVDAVVTDPPYGMNYDTDSTRFSGRTKGLRRGQGRTDRLIEGDDVEFDPTPWLVFDEVVLWGANHFAKNLPLGTTLVWLKRYPEHYGTFLSDAEMAWQNKGCGIYVFNAPDSIGRRRFEYTGDIMGEETAHVSQKPVALMDWCIKRVNGQIILDPFMGSGTTGVAAVKLGRKFIGIEIHEPYFDIACRRISEALKQPDMFIEKPKPAVQEALTF